MNDLMQFAPGTAALVDALRLFFEGDHDTLRSMAQKSGHPEDTPPVVVRQYAGVYALTWDAAPAAAKAIVDDVHGIWVHSRATAFRVYDAGDKHHEVQCETIDWLDPKDTPFWRHVHTGEGKYRTEGVRDFLMQACRPLTNFNRNRAAQWRLIRSQGVDVDGIRRAVQSKREGRTLPTVCFK